MVILAAGSERIYKGRRLNAVNFGVLFLFCQSRIYCSVSTAMEVWNSAEVRIFGIILPRNNAEFYGTLRAKFRGIPLAIAAQGKVAAETCKNVRDKRLRSL
jgi:hypothetical protein